MIAQRRGGRGLARWLASSGSRRCPFRADWQRSQHGSVVLRLLGHGRFPSQTSRSPAERDRMGRTGIGILERERAGYGRRVHLAHRLVRSGDAYAVLAHRESIPRFERGGARRRQSLHRFDTGGESRERLAEVALSVYAARCERAGCDRAAGISKCRVSVQAAQVTAALRTGTDSSMCWTG